MEHKCSGGQTGAETVNIRVENLAPEDARFLRCVVALFTDPNFKAVVGDLRRGLAGVKWAKGGHARVFGLLRDGQKYQEN